MIKKLTSRYDIVAMERRKICPDFCESDRRIVDAISAIHPGRSVFYVIFHTPEQMEDIYTILLDGETIVKFELPKYSSDTLPSEIQKYSVKEFKKIIGQGKNLTLLSALIELSRKDLADTGKEKAADAN
ncbi:hypothetical protein [Methylobacterium phyllostachyos]|uniref:hypothetical protein n=1 Tax=Methylobacterium phyllostachyos TaxID=582672 RepID=UPI00115FE70A|nr:hypothetical protein [Methylobacterium phyllostachyos]